MLNQGHYEYENVLISPGVVVLDPTTTSIGAGTIIEANTVIYPKTLIGENVYISAGCVIGSRPFIYKIGVMELPKHESVSGGVTIMDDVEIGACCTIDAGRKMTILREGCKIDNLCHIAHDCIIGRGSLLVGGTILGGHVEIRDGARTGLNSTIRNRIIVGENAFIGMDVSVCRNVVKGRRVTIMKL